MGLGSQGWTSSSSPPALPSWAPILVISARSPGTGRTIRHRQPTFVKLQFRRFLSGTASGSPICSTANLFCLLFIGNQDVIFCLQFSSDLPFPTRPQNVISSRLGHPFPKFPWNRGYNLSGSCGTPGPLYKLSHLSCSSIPSWHYVLYPLRRKDHFLWQSS